MEGVGFAIAAAVGFAFFNVLTQLGVKDSRIHPFTALFLNLTGGTVVLVLAVLLTGGISRETWAWEGVWYFAAAGLITALAGQAALISSIPRIGATRASCFLLADNIFALILGYLALGQTVSTISGIGILILMTGAVLFILETAGGSNRVQPQVRDTRRLLVGISMALLGAICFATGGVLRGKGVALMPAAIVGSAINIVAGLVAVTIVCAVRGRLRDPFTVGWRRGGFLLLSGVANAAGTLGFILALQYGVTVAVTTALKNTSPLLTFALAIPLLRRHERLSVRLGLLVCLVVAGAVLIALGRL